jgi:hypothetical protein
VWFYRKRLIVMVPGEGSGTDIDSFANKATFIFLRGTINWEKLVKDAADFRDEQLRNLNSTRKRFSITKCWAHNAIVTHDNKENNTEPESRQKPRTSDDPGDPVFWNRDDIGPPVNDRALRTLALTSSMNKVVDRVRFWYRNKIWYKDRGIQWKTAILLYGGPGNGKTSLARAICEELDLPMYLMDLSEMDSDDLTNAWERTRYNKPRAIVLEDIDTVFDKRKNITKSGTVSFETLLNLMDGADREDGLVVFVTTNKVDKIDSALGRPVANDKSGRSTRPSRVDLCAFVDNPDSAGRELIAQKILQNDKLAKDLAAKHEGTSGAQFQDICIEKAKSLFWEQKANNT